MTKNIPKDIQINVEDQIERQGMAAYKVEDGEVFVFTKAILATLLKNAAKTGRVILFMKTGPTA